MPLCQLKRLSEAFTRGVCKNLDTLYKILKNSQPTKTRNDRQNKECNKTRDGYDVVATISEIQFVFLYINEIRIYCVVLIICYRVH